MNFTDYNTFIRDIKLFIETLPKFDFVSYIPRSGVIPAFIYSKRYNIPIIELDKCENKENVLIFDDSVNYGRRLISIQKELTNPSYAVVYYTDEKILNYKLDFKYKQISQPRIFEWNWINQENLINRSCFDLDGVLCHFPRDKLSSGEMEYKYFLQNAKPKYIPDFEIGTICTARLESDRKETEEWLRKNNVKYRKLIMLNSTKEERIRFGLHTKPKIEEYSKMGYSLFVEDEIEQAIIISRITGKPVLCITNWKIYQEYF